MAQLPIKPTLQTFPLYRNILEGELRPHLPAFSKDEHVRHIFFQQVCDSIGRKEKEVSPEIIKGSNGSYLRYADVYAAKGELRVFIVHPNSNKVVSFIKPSPHPSTFFDSFTPKNIKEAFFLFLIEREYNRIASSISSQLATLPSKELKNNSRHQLQIIKLLAVQSRAYENYVHSYYSDRIENNITTHAIFVNRRKISVPSTTRESIQEDFDSTLFVIEVLKKCITHTVLMLQEVFEPYINIKPLTEQEIKKKYFQEKEKINKRRLKWVDLFKDTKAADLVLDKLREDGYITQDNKWKGKNSQRRMVALFIALQNKNYLKENQFTAEQLSNAFSSQFHMSFKSNKAWQTSEQEKAQKHVGLFDLIPPYLPSKIK